MDITSEELQQQYKPIPKSLPKGKGLLLNLEGLRLTFKVCNVHFVIASPTLSNAEEAGEAISQKT